MKNSILTFILCLLISFGVKDQVTGQVNSVMSYNIRYDNPNDSINKWDKRKFEVVDLLKYYKPDIFGIQEGLNHQLTFLDEKLISYSRIGVGRDDGDKKGEFCAIFYKNSELSLITESTFWLSPTDDKVSVGWDASMERVCSYGIFENRISKERILVLNAHFDHMGALSREKSAELILSKISEINKANYPVILMGDFNSEPESKPIDLLAEKLDDAAKLAINEIYGPVGTFTGFKKDAIAQKRIDYIFVKGLEVRTYRHVDDRMRNSNYLSDHLPVLVRVE